MKSHDSGYIDIEQYDDIFTLIDEHDIESWCSASLKDRVFALRKAYFGLVHDLADEWCNR